MGRQKKVICIVCYKGNNENLLSNSRLRTRSWLCFCNDWAEPPQPGGRASATEGRASATRTPTKLAEVDLCWLNLNFGLYYKLDSMKTWENCNRTLFLLPHLGNRKSVQLQFFQVFLLSSLFYRSKFRFNQHKSILTTLVWVLHEETF